mmetsp:Transcript_15845/g.24676  ORF Transcript_15845/g.24676 Transcript_15845/m.24676 type:complete len:460 (+) Transcript_15845:80-1459(+)
MNVHRVLSKTNNTVRGNRLVTAAMQQQQSVFIGHEKFVQQPRVWNISALGSSNNAPFTWKAAISPFRSFSTDMAPLTISNTTAANAAVTVNNDAEIAKIIRNIKADLVEADINHDQKIDAEELKGILRKYPKIFTDQDIIEIGELFYTARGGESVSHERFMKAISNTVQGKDDIDEDGTQHRRKGSLSHPLGLGTCSTEYMYGKTRGLYSDEELQVKLTHVEPKTTSDKIAKAAVGVVRFLFDAVSMWNTGEITQAKVLRRVIFLETVAGIPGFVAAMNRHFRSLRTFTRDGGMLNMFLDEANNERMHLLSFVRMRDPGMFMRGVVLGSQAVVGTGFLVLYAINSDFCHRFVGYVEEEACHTYTVIINEIEAAPEARDISEWRTQLAPKIARGYWHLGDNGTVLDMMYAIRADEAEHRDVNHVVSGLGPDQPNPLYNPEEKFDQVLKKYVENMLKRGQE